MQIEQDAQSISSKSTDKRLCLHKYFQPLVPTIPFKVMIEFQKNTEDILKTAGVWGWDLSILA